MPRDIRNIERGACIDGCRSCPNFLSVEPGRILCDYCGCPPTKHEIVQSHSLMTIHDGDKKCESKQNAEKELDRIKELKNDGLCFSASRTSSNDSGCYISCSSFGSSSTSTSASTSSCSPYISEEEAEGVEDDCFISPKEDEKLDDKLSPNFTTAEQKDDCLELQSDHGCSVGVYNCASTEMVVKIRTKTEQPMVHDEKKHIPHNPLMNPKDWENSTVKCGSDKYNDCKHQIITDQLHILKSTNLNPAFKTCKRKAKKYPVIQAGNHQAALTLSAPASNSMSEEEATVEENCTLQGMGQLEIGDENTILSDTVTSEKKTGENKIIRAEGDCDVSDHNRKTMAGIAHNGKRSEQLYSNRVCLRYRFTNP